MDRGLLAGYPLTDIKAVLLDGSYHEVDSSEIAFRIAASMALQQAARRAEPMLLEPVMSIEIICPGEYVSEVIGDLNSRRGKVEELLPRAGSHLITGKVPLAEMFGYTTILRSISQGRAVHSMKIFSYHTVPKEIADSVISKTMGVCSN